MKTQLFLSMSFFALASICCSHLLAQTELPYFTGFDNATEQEGWEQYRIGHEGDFNEWYITEQNGFSPPHMIYHNYPVGGSEVTDDWYVSPPFDLSGGGAIDSLRFKFAGFGTPSGNDTIGIYLLNGSADPEIASRTLLFSFRDSSYLNDNMWRKLEDVEIPATSGVSHIAFRYTTVVNWLDVHFDNLALSGTSTVGIPESSSDRPLLLVFPNPVKDFAKLSFTENTAITRTELIGLNGSIIRTYRGNMDVVDFSEIVAGQYVLKVYYDGGVVSQKILVE